MTKSRVNFTFIKWRRLRLRRQAKETCTYQLFMFAVSYSALYVYCICMYDLIHGKYPLSKRGQLTGIYPLRTCVDSHFRTFDDRKEVFPFCIVM